MTGETKAGVAQDQPTFTVREVLRGGARLLSQAGIESAQLDADVLLRHVLRVDREELYLSYEKSLSGRAHELYQKVISRRALNEPVAYITQSREFWSVDFRVTSDVLIPRPETELLVEVALELSTANINGSRLRMVDLGTGSGAIAICLAKERPGAEICATDVSESALDVARENAARHGVEHKIHFVEGDLFTPLYGRNSYFHLIVSNPPYVRREEWQLLAPDVRDWEPRLALDGGEDGMDLYRRIVKDAPLYLADGGFLVLEFGIEMGQEISRLIAAAGCYEPARVHQDFAGKDRVVAARIGHRGDRGSVFSG